MKKDHHELKKIEVMDQAVGEVAEAKSMTMDQSLLWSHCNIVVTTSIEFGPLSFLHLEAILDLLLLQT